jgi:hypothetical protein
VTTYKLEGQLFSNIFEIIWFMLFYLHDFSMFSFKKPNKSFHLPDTLGMQVSLRWTRCGDVVVPALEGVCGREVAWRLSFSSPRASPVWMKWETHWLFVRDGFH